MKRHALCALAALTAGLGGCPGEDFPIAEPFPDFITEPTGGAVDASVADSSSLNVSYYPTVREALTRCVECHGGDGPIAPSLHSYSAARNGVDQAIRALADGHTGDFAHLECPSPDASGAGEDAYAQLTSYLSAWRDHGYPAGVPEPPPETIPLPAADRVLTTELVSFDAPRCYVLGEADETVARVRFSTSALAWVEVYAVAPPLAPSLPALEAADAAAGWTCDGDLGLVPQPLVAAWQLGDPPLDLTRSPLLLVPGSTLVARVDRSFLPTAIDGPALTIELWGSDGTEPGMAFVPIATSTTSVGLPWIRPSDETLNELEALYSDRAVADLRVASPDGPPPTTCLHGGSSRQWPELSLYAPSPVPALDDGTRITLRCSTPGCTAQLGLSGVPSAEPCDSSASHCIDDCAGDLACAWTCAAAVGERCALCVVSGQLACRTHACAGLATTATERLESCAQALAPIACIASDVMSQLTSCSAPTPLCAPALSACLTATD